MTFALRDYQQACVDEIRHAHTQSDSVLIELPTGTGKTEVFVDYAGSYKDGRALVICPQVQLIRQAADKIHSRLGVYPAIEQASLWSDESAWGQLPFVVGSKQTLCKTSTSNPNPRYKRFNDIGLVVIDEAHYACTKPYANMVHHFRDRGAKVLGVTATPKRHDGRAMGQLFDTVAYQYAMLDAINDGWLVTPRVTCKQLETLDLSEVKTANTVNGKDFNEKQLNEQLENEEVIFEICEAIVAETKGLKTAVYCSSVAEAQAVAELLEDRYRIRAAWICADKRCPEKNWKEAMDGFTAGDITHLCNVGQLTTGWDYPALQAIVMARPTQSLSLYTQIIGRGTRPLPGTVDFPDSDPTSRKCRIAGSQKPHFRVIDLVDNSMAHKIVTAADVLGGKWDMKVIERVKQDALTTGRIDLQESAERAQQQIESDAIWEENRRLRALRAERIERAKWNDFDVDPFGGRRGRIKAREGAAVKYPPTKKQIGYIWHLGFKTIDRYDISRAQAGRIINQMKAGASVAEVKATNALEMRFGKTIE